MRTLLKYVKNKSLKSFVVADKIFDFKIEWTLRVQHFNF